MVAAIGLATGYQVDFIWWWCGTFLTQTETRGVGKAWWRRTSTAVVRQEGGKRRKRYMFCGETEIMMAFSRALTITLLYCYAWFWLWLTVVSIVMFTTLFVETYG